jgi:limonene-1,2-epoxide hydrolase
MTASEMDTKADARAVETFLYALESKDFDAAEAVMADDMVYENYGYTRMRGRTRIMRLFRKGPAWFGFEVKILRTTTDGDSVMNERIDALVFGPVRIQIGVCGVFEVHGGKITLWRDYFDLYDVLKGTARGLVGAVVPSLRPTL